MGYDFHIRRPQGPIPLEEWHLLLRDEAARWELKDELKGTNPITGEEMLLRSPPGNPYAVWKGHPERPAGVTFMYTKAGKITVSARSMERPGHPDDPCMAKLHQVARWLRAEVVGDEGELYHDGLRGRVAAAAAGLRTAITLARAAFAVELEEELARSRARDAGDRRPPGS